MSHCSGSRPLGHHHHQTLTETPLTHPAVAPSHGDPVAIVVIVLQDYFLHMLKQVTDVTDVRLGQPKAQGVGLGCS